MTIFSKNVFAAIGAFCILATLFAIFGLAYFKRKAHRNLADQVYAVLDQYRVTYDIDKRSTDPSITTAPQIAKGVDGCIGQLVRFVEREQTIPMILIGFPFKSANHEKKTIGALPDMAERKSFEYLQTMLDQIKAVYPPGATITIFCDGIPFADFLGISSAEVIAYEEALQKLAVDFSGIRILPSSWMLQEYGWKSVDEINGFIDTYPPTNADFKAGLKEAPTTMMNRLAVEFDHAQGKQLLAKISLEDRVIGLLAREMRLRSYIAEKFPANKFFRLTAHLSEDVGKKFGIKLSPSSDITPYHGVLVQEADGSWIIRFKKDVDSREYKLVSQNINGVVCWYFTKK